MSKPVQIKAQRAAMEAYQKVLSSNKKNDMFPGDSSEEDSVQSHSHSEEENEG